jgi:hypothetical protein
VGKSKEVPNEVIPKVQIVSGLLREGQRNPREVPGKLRKLHKTSKRRCSQFGEV